MTFGDPPPRRRPSLTPMIDVVFLLLVFFMLASRFGTELQLPLSTAGGGPEARWSGPPRLVEIAPEALRLNGTEVPLDALPGALEPLVESPADTVILRPAAGAELQRLVAVMEHLGAAGFGSLVLVGEAP